MSADQPTPPAIRPQPRQGQTVNLDRQMCKLRYSPCGQFLVAGGSDATVRRWSIKDATLEAMPHLTGHHGWVQAFAFHPDRRRLFTADSWGEIRCWPYADREPQPIRVTAAAHDGWIRDLVISADGKLVATCGMDRKVRLWSAEDGRKLHEMPGHDTDVFCVAFHPDSKSLVSGDQFGNVFQWDVSNGQRMRTFDAKALYSLSRLQDVGGVRRLEFDATGQKLACAGTRPTTGGNVQGVPTILFFDWAAGRLQHTVNIGNEGDGYITDLAFHPAGFVLAVTSGNPGTGKFFLQYPADREPFFTSTRMPNCHALAVHPDGRRLIVSATNAGSNGNGRPLRNGEYPGNFSPLHLWELPA